ncbi:MAG: DUF58 domain-containing protein [Terriglobales bacterium]
MRRFGFGAPAPGGKRRRPRPRRDEARLSWPHVASILVMLLAAFAFALLADWAPSALAQAGLAALSLALLLVAAALTLPALLRRTVLRRWLRWQTQVRFTAAGLPFLAALVILIIAAINSGNNLVYMVVAALLGALVTSGFFSAFNLSGLALDLRWPDQAFAGQPVPVQLTLENEKHWLPSYSLSVSASSQPLSPSGEAVAMRTTYFPYLPRRRHARALTEITFPRRGHYSAASLVLATRFPFGLIDKRRPFEPAAGSTGLVVFPRLRAETEEAAAMAAASAERTRLAPGAGHELYRVRPLAPGDNLRLVHWKASAKTGELRVREFSREEDQRWRIVLALTPGQATPEQMEACIELCASLVWSLAHATDARIEFLGCNPAREPLRSSRDAAESLNLASRPASEALHPVLRYLALADTAATPRPWQFDARLPQRLFLARPAGERVAGACYACDL